MSRFTESLYRSWLGQNGSAGSRRRAPGGIGGRAPDVRPVPRNVPPARLAQVPSAPAIASRGVNPPAAVSRPARERSESARGAAIAPPCPSSPLEKPVLTEGVPSSDNMLPGYDLGIEDIFFPANEDYYLGGER